MNRDRAKAIDLIKRNIAKSGFHIYLVTGNGPPPRFAYTIGLRESLGAELVLAGALFYDDAHDVLEIIHSVRKQLAKGIKGKLGPPWQSTFAVRRLGKFTLRKTHASWSRAMLLGALDYYGLEDVAAFQIVPEEKHRTVDVPNMAKKLSVKSEPIWRWLKDDRSWRYPVPRTSEAMTNLDALRGARITEARRWEAEYWEMFAGAAGDVPKAECRLIPLATLLAADPTLARVAALKIGTGIWREAAKPFHTHRQNAWRALRS